MLYHADLYTPTLYERQPIIGYRIFTLEATITKGMAVTVQPVWEGITPPNSKIYFEFSADDGSTWTRVLNGDTSAYLPILATESGSHTILFKTTLETVNRKSLPYLSILTVTLNQVPTLYSLAYNVLIDAGLTETEFWIDPELLTFPVPHAWLNGNNHYAALEQLIDTCLGQCYVDRAGTIRLEGPSYQKATSQPPHLTPDQYFKKSLTSNETQQANYVEAYASPLQPTTATQVVYRSNNPINIATGETKTITAFYTAFYTQNPVIDCAATLEGAPVGAAITNEIYYAWGGIITITSPASGSFTLIINGKPLKVKGRTRAVAQDTTSINEYGLYSYKLPVKKLVQTPAMAQKIADLLLQKFKEAPQVFDLTYQGDPALELDDLIVIENLRHPTTDNCLIKSHELKFDGTLEGRIKGLKTI